MLLIVFSPWKLKSIERSGVSLIRAKYTELNCTVYSELNFGAAEDSLLGFPRLFYFICSRIYVIGFEASSNFVPSIVRKNIYLKLSSNSIILS